MLLPILKQLGKIVKTAEQGNGRISHEGVFLVCGYMWIPTQAMPDLGNSPSTPSQRPANLKNRPQQVPLPIRLPTPPNQGKGKLPGVGHTLSRTRVTKAFDPGQDGFGGRYPDKGTGLGVVVFHKGIDFAGEFANI